MASTKTRVAPAKFVPKAPAFLRGGGEMAELIREYDWTTTSLGSIEDWPQCLQTSVNIVLQSPVPLVMLWDVDGIMIYNDAYSVFSGARHPRLLGSKVVEGWPEVADFNRNVMDKGLKGQKLSYKDQQLTLYRNNVPEEVWMDLNYSPIMDETGRPAGVLAIVVETTERVLAEERQKQAELALRSSEQRSRAFIRATSDVIYRMSPDWSEMWELEGQGFLSDTGVPITNWLEKYIDSADQAHVLERIKHAVEHRTIFQLEHKVKLADGGFGWTLSRAVPLIDEHDNIIEWFGMATDITEEKRAHEEQQKLMIMTQQRNALIKVNKTKDEFIALASHQLRTPATAVKQYVGLLMNEFVGPLSTDQLQYLQIAYNSNERELSIINDLLKTAQIDSNKYQLQKQLYDIVPIVQEAVGDLESAFDQRKQHVHCECPPEVIQVLVDATEIKVIFVNLLENASKYSYPGSEIRVDVVNKDKYVEIAVTDNGVGISKENQQRIFDKFTRINNDLSDTVTGTGLGLYWVKQIVELHKGKVKLTSTPGEGSTFTVRLPHE